MSLMDMLVQRFRDRQEQPVDGGMFPQAGPGTSVPGPVTGTGPISISPDPAQQAPAAPWQDFGDTNFSQLLNQMISEGVLSQDPFPHQLVPPFQIRPGSTGSGSLFGSGGGASLNLGDFDPTTRELQPEELTSFQLEQLLASDSPFIQQARREGERTALARGGLSPTMAAGAAQAAAIRSGLPIAGADAQAHIRAASENMMAVNQNTMAKLQSATNMAVTNATVAGQLGAARIASDARERIAELQLNAQYTMQQGLFSQQQFMEQMIQEGRIDLAQLGFAHDFNMADLSHSQRIEIEEMFGQPRFDAQLQFSQAQFDAQLQFSQAQMQTNLASTALSNYAQMVSNMNQLDIDDAARQRGLTFAERYLTSFLGMIGFVGDTNNWPDFDFDFG